MQESISAFLPTPDRNLAVYEVPKEIATAIFDSRSCHMVLAGALLPLPPYLLSVVWRDPLVREKEAAAIKSELELKIKHDVKDPKLDERIALLPENLRASIEEFRKRLLLERKEAEAAELQHRKEAEAAELQHRKEAEAAELQRRKKAEAAEALRRQGREAAELQRRKEADTAEAEQRKHRDAMEAGFQQLKEAKRKDEELEQRRREGQDRQERQAIAGQMEAARKLEEQKEQERSKKLRQFNATHVTFGDDLHDNSFRFKGQIVGLKEVTFKRMIEAGIGVFETKSRHELLISGLPVDSFERAGETSGVIVRVLGTKQVRNAVGGTLLLTHVEYIAALP